MSVDHSRSGQVERDIEQAIIALKKGAYLLKYGRRGKPKFCPFRLANDESVLIWFSGKEEKHLKLSHVSRIIPGQRTPIFQRYPRPEKECQSFSLMYNDRSLDLICKDKDEAEVWFAGLKALITRSHQRKFRTESRSDSVSSGANSPKTYTHKSSPLSSPFGSSDDIQKDGDLLRFRSPFGSPSRNGFDETSYNRHLKGFLPKVSAENSMHSSTSSGGLDNSINKHTRGPPMEAFRVSLSSAVSSSSQGSGQDEGDALGDVFIWGEGVGDGFLGGGIHRVGTQSSAKMDSFTPKALESAVILDVQNISCGGKHTALVTKQGEIYSWGEELGGRLGHGVDSDVSQPKLIDSLSNTNVEFVACGEHHTCAVTMSGDLYTWGDGTHNFGLLGHGNEASHWIPKRVNGPLEGVHVSSVSCGAWHTAVVTSSGQLFTFGDGTFGVLGHGDRRSISIPKEVESLRGLRTIRAACGVWHTAAVVEVMAGNSGSSNTSSGKLFTWGDGDKWRLGHGDKEPRLVPTCVAALVEANLCQVACGHSMTAALTTSGHVYTMGSPVYGQLGNPKADGKLPVCVEGKLLNNFVEEISCGGYHVAVLTSRTEVYTWGKGANGRLGHGDTNDRNSPSLVEALKDKQVRSIVCGTNFTACICIHKWASGVDQSMCSGCRLPFNFKRKRHNCYHCALLFCHSCSSKKSLRASMAPNPNKPHRVCDNCFNKLKKSMEIESSPHVSTFRKGNLYQREQFEKEEKDSRIQVRTSKIFSVDSLKQLEIKSSKKNNSRGSQITYGNYHWTNVSKTFNPVFGSSKKFFSSSVPGSRIVSRTTSPISRRSSPPRSTTPTPTLSGLTTPRFGVDDTKTTSQNLSQEVLKLKSQVESLTLKSQRQEAELDRALKQVKEAMALAEEEAAKCKAAKEVIKTLTTQLKEMAERLPVGVGRNGKLPSITSLSSALSDTSSVATDQTDIPTTISHESQVPNGSNSSGSKNKVDYSESIRNGTKSMDAESNSSATEWVEQDEPGVYITLISLSGGARELKRVRFSRKRFSEKQAEQWWAENRMRVYEQYNIRTNERSNNETLHH